MTVSDAPRPPLIRFTDVHKAFGAKKVLRGFSLSVNEGEVMFVIGTSGVGKSVSIKHLIGLLRPDAGTIEVDGQPVHRLSEADTYPLRKQIGMVFQSSTLFDSMSALDNVALPLRKHAGLTPKAARARAAELLDQVGMADFAHRFAAELGDGMRKRVAIARTMALDPRCILFDEPTTGLDPVSARRVDALIAKLKAMGVTSVVVSHDLVSIFSVADRIAFVYRGKVHCVGTPQQYKDSDDPVVQQFIQGRSEGPMETPGF